ncbi:hypothetical protein O3M35_013260 [Rhynocoris fuscipes]|uniref:Uncharacterized protein n=1 Tax=Rhynocoris fuscipes TaxID=488301 RepID=A0AAW1CJ37_9HEMI
MVAPGLLLAALLYLLSSVSPLERGTGVTGQRRGSTVTRTSQQQPNIRPNISNNSGGTITGALIPPVASLRPPPTNITIGLILPKTLFGARSYNRAINDAVNGLYKPRGRKLGFLKRYAFTAGQVNTQMMVLTPSPTGIIPYCLHSNIFFK